MPCLLKNNKGLFLADWTQTGPRFASADPHGNVPVLLIGDQCANTTIFQLAKYGHEAHIVPQCSAEVPPISKDEALVMEAFDAGGLTGIVTGFKSYRLCLDAPLHDALHRVLGKRYAELYNGGAQPELPAPPQPAQPARPASVKDLYALYTKGQLELNNCIADAWGELDEEDQAVWTRMYDTLYKGEGV